MHARQAAALAALVLALPLSGCARAAGQVPVSLALLPERSPALDPAFEAAARAGLDACRRGTGLQPRALDAVPPRDYEQQLGVLATENADTVVALGYGIAGDVEAAARRFGKTHFALIDGVVDEPNAESVTFAGEQSGFLAGALAALVSRSGTVAFLGGADAAEIRPSEVGFLAGARAVRPGVATVVRYVGSFGDRAAGVRAADALFAGRADVVYAAAGSSGLGAIDAAKRRRGAYVIGSDSDQDGLAPGIVLSSALKHVDVAVRRVCEETASRKPVSGRLVLGLADGAVGLTDFRYSKAAIGAANLARLERLRAAIAAGELVPPATRAELARFRAPAPR